MVHPPTADALAPARLISTNKSISEIGLACNFPNTSHFIKLFKKEYGMTPAAYRNRHQQSIAEDGAGPRDIPAERDRRAGCGNPGPGARQKNLPGRRITPGGMLCRPG